MSPENQEEAAAEKPLLSAAGSRSGGSISGAIFNVSTGMVGAGIMSVPATFKVLGVVPSLFAILVVAYFVEVTVDFLLKFTISGETDSYGGLMAESFGRFGSLALQICVLITNLGALIIYLIIIGDVLSGNDSDGTLHLGVLQEWFGIHWWTSRPFSVLVVVLFVMLPLLCLRRIDSLRHASAISILLAVLFVAVCSGMALYSLWKGETESLRLFPDFSNGISFFDLFTTIPVFATAFGCHVNKMFIKHVLSRIRCWRYWSLCLQLGLVRQPFTLMYQLILSRSNQI
ncbi:unnamed protein product [Cuscuta epithymum]|uniref:Amino acid transporter transmembrane domain-containing protein n=1 Tax=Cuscuta epithymum TaxID=186058 RepID=A0AAV0FPK4_9ASTE|nr:unnamed protein product [Cuscuta epithymum]